MGEADFRYRANNLFYVSMSDHLHDRGYVRSVQGSPMCGCVEHMPIVSRSDCTESQQKNFTGSHSLITIVEILLQHSTTLILTLMHVEQSKIITFNGSMNAYLMKVV